MSDIVTHLTEKSGYVVEGIEYPNIEVLDVGDAFAVLSTCLKSGNIPIYIEHAGCLHRIKNRVSADPISLSKVLRVYKMHINVSETESHLVTNVEELLELGEWW